MLDIETAPNVSYTWGLFQQDVGLSQLVEPGSILCIGASWYGSKKSMYTSVQWQDRHSMLMDVHGWLDEADVVVGWNSKAFDIPWIHGEMVMNGIKPSSPFKQVDLYVTSKSQFKFPSNKLEYVAKYLTGKEKIKTDFSLWKGVMNGDAKSWKQMEQYCKNDVMLLHEIYEHFRPWIKNHPNFATYNPSEELQCAHCGSKDLQKRGTAKTQAGLYTLFQCNDCGKYGRQAQNLLTKEERAAVLRQV